MKKALPLSLLVIVGLLATGCSFKSNGTVATAQAQVRVWRVNQDIDTLRDIITQFQKDTKKVTVTYSNKSATNYELRSIKSLAARKGPDVWSIPSDWLGDQQDLLIAFPNDYFYPTGKTTGPSALESVKLLYPQGIVDQIADPNGKVYGIPTNVDTLRLYYNSDVFSEATTDFRKSLGSDYKDEDYQPVRQLLSKPPATWSDLLAQTKYITQRSNQTITRSAIALGTADNTRNAQDILQLLMLQNGAKITSTDRTSALFHIPTTTPAGTVVRPGLNALDFYTSFADPTKSNYSWNPSMPDPIDAFGQGKVAMLIGYADTANQLRIKYPKFHPDVAPMPQISTTQTPVNFIRFSAETVTQTADNAVDAFNFIARYTDKGTSKSLARSQKLFSPYTATLKDSDDPIGNQVLTGQGVYKKSHTQFDEIFRVMIIDVDQNKLPVDQALDKGADGINQLLKDTSNGTINP